MHRWKFKAGDEPAADGYQAPHPCWSLMPDSRLDMPTQQKRARVPSVVSEKVYSPSWPSANSLVNAEWRILHLYSRGSLWVLNMHIDPGVFKATVSEVKSLSGYEQLNLPTSARYSRRVVVPSSWDVFQLEAKPNLRGEVQEEVEVDELRNRVETVDVPCTLSSHSDCWIDHLPDILALYIPDRRSLSYSLSHTDHSTITTNLME